MSLVILAAGLGCMWHGLQIVWVAPTPRALQKDRATQPPEDKALAFQLFWLDQYAWIGIVLTVLGLGLCLTALI